MVNYFYQNIGDEKNITLIFGDGHAEVIDSNHRNLEPIARIVEDAIAEQNFDLTDREDELRTLANLGTAVQARLTSVFGSEQFTSDGHEIFFDGDVVHGALADTLLRAFTEADGFEKNALAVARFADKLFSNPSESARASLYEFIQRHNITIDPDGDFYMYKGVKADGGSIHTGRGIVDGVLFENASLLNLPGSTIEIPRSAVDADTFVGCSTGLHVGSYEYASGFAQGQLLLTKVNPRDVVSVPNDCNFQKIRVCRYVVVSATEHKIERLVNDINFTGKSGGTDFTDIGDAITEEGVAEMELTYTNGSGDAVDVRVDINEVIQAGGNRIVLVGEKNGSPFSVLYDYITSFTVLNAVEDEDDDDDDSDYWEDDWNADFDDDDDDDDEVDAGSESITANYIREGDVVSFDYKRVDGTAGALPEGKVTAIQGNLISVELPDGSFRRYRMDGLNNITRFI